MIHPIVIPHVNVHGLSGVQALKMEAVSTSNVGKSLPEYTAQQLRK
jgi:hypothetical protein